LDSIFGHGLANIDINDVIRQATVLFELVDNTNPALPELLLSLYLEDGWAYVDFGILSETPSVKVDVMPFLGDGRSAAMASDEQEEASKGRWFYYLQGEDNQPYYVKGLGNVTKVVLVNQNVNDVDSPATLTLNSESEWSRYFSFAKTANGLTAISLLPTAEVQTLNKQAGGAYYRVTFVSDRGEVVVPLKVGDRYLLGFDGAEHILGTIFSVIRGFSATRNYIGIDLGKDVLAILDEMFGLHLGLDVIGGLGAYVMLKDSLLVIDRDTYEQSAMDAITYGRTDVSSDLTFSLGGVDVSSATKVRLISSRGEVIDDTLAEAEGNMTLGADSLTLSNKGLATLNTDKWKFELLDDSDAVLFECYFYKGVFMSLGLNVDGKQFGLGLDIDNYCIALVTEADADRFNALNYLTDTYLVDENAVGGTKVTAKPSKLTKEVGGVKVIDSDRYIDVLRDLNSVYLSLTVDLHLDVDDNNLSNPSNWANSNGSTFGLGDNLAQYVGALFVNLGLNASQINGDYVVTLRVYLDSLDFTNFDMRNLQVYLKLQKKVYNTTYGGVYYGAEGVLMDSITVYFDGATIYINGNPDLFTYIAAPAIFIPIEATMNYWGLNRATAAAMEAHTPQALASRYAEAGEGFSVGGIVSLLRNIRLGEGYIGVGLAGDFMGKLLGMFLDVDVNIDVDYLDMDIQILNGALGISFAKTTTFEPSKVLDQNGDPLYVRAEDFATIKVDETAHTVALTDVAALHLPQGEWTLTASYQDGSTKEATISKGSDVVYKAQGATVSTSLLYTYFFETGTPVSFQVSTSSVTLYEQEEDGYHVRTDGLYILRTLTDPIGADSVQVTLNGLGKTLTLDTKAEWPTLTLDGVTTRVKYQRDYFVISHPSIADYSGVTSVTFASDGLYAMSLTESGANKQSVSMDVLIHSIELGLELPAEYRTQAGGGVPRMGTA